MNDNQTGKEFSQSAESYIDFLNRNAIKWLAKVTDDERDACAFWVEKAGVSHPLSAIEVERRHELTITPKQTVL